MYIHMYTHTYMCVRETETFQLLVHFLNGCNSQDWLMWKPGTRDMIQSPHADDRDVSIWAIFHCFLLSAATSAERWIGNRASRTSMGSPIRAVSVARC